MARFFIIIVIGLSSCDFTNLSLSPPPQSAAFYNSIDLPVIFLKNITTSTDSDGNNQGQFEIYANRDNFAGLYNSLGNPSFLTNEQPLLVGEMGYRIRGQSSASMPKKSFAFETRLSQLSTEALDLSILGFASDNDYVFHASYTDKSLMRNYFMYTIGQDLFDWQPHVRYFELYGNQLVDAMDSTTAYQGIYVLTEKIKRGKNRVQLASKNPQKQASEVGYLLKIDKTGGSEWYPSGLTAENLSVVDPDSSEITTAQQEYISKYLSDMESAMSGPDRYDAIKGYTKYLDTNTFIDFFLMNELAKNVDGYRISTFMTKDAGQKLKAGPLWDFDIALGNADYYEGWDSSDWVIVRMLEGMLGGDMGPPILWWTTMFKDPEFRKEAQVRWHYLRQNILSDLRISQLFEGVEQRLSKALERNFTVWDVLHTYDWPNVMPIPNNPKNPADYTWKDHENYLRDWLNDRIKWMDSEASWKALDNWANS